MGRGPAYSRHTVGTRLQVSGFRGSVLDWSVCVCVYLCACLGGIGVSVAFVNRGRERAQSREEPGKKLIIIKLLQHASLRAMVSLEVPLLILRTSLRYISTI